MVLEAWPTVGRFGSCWLFCRLNLSCPFKRRSPPYGLATCCGCLPPASTPLTSADQFRTAGVERVQALADISRSALCCHSNETRASIANPPNTEELGAPLPFSKLHLGPCSTVGMMRGTDRQTRVTNIHFASSTTHAKKCKNNRNSIGARELVFPARIRHCVAYVYIAHAQ